MKGRGNAANALIGRDLIQEFGQYWSIPDVAASDLDGPYLQCFLINTDVNLTPNTPFGATMLTGIPLAFALRLDARAVDKEVQCTLRSAIRQGHFQRSLATT